MYIYTYVSISQYKKGIMFTRASPAIFSFHPQLSFLWRMMTCSQFETSSVAQKHDSKTLGYANPLNMLIVYSSVDLPEGIHIWSPYHPQVILYSCNPLPRYHQIIIPLLSPYCPQMISIYSVVKILSNHHPHIIHLVSPYIPNSCTEIRLPSLCVSKEAAIQTT